MVGRGLNRQTDRLRAVSKKPQRAASWPPPVAGRGAGTASCPALRPLHRGADLVAPPFHLSPPAHRCSLAGCHQRVSGGPAPGGPGQLLRGGVLRRQRGADLQRAVGQRVRLPGRGTACMPGGGTACWGTARGGYCMWGTVGATTGAGGMCVLGGAIQGARVDTSALPRATARETLSATPHLRSAAQRSV